MEPERDQLFRNLFISAESKDYEGNLSRGRILSPDFIRIILDDVKKEPRNVRMEIVKRLLEHFQQNVNNSIILNSKDELLAEQSLSIFDELVSFTLRFISSREDVSIYSSLFSSVVSHYAIGLRNFTNLTKELGKDYHLEKFDENRFRFVLRMLKIFYTSRPVLKSQPLNYFYFYGPESGIRLKNSDVKWPFHQHLSLLVCFSLDKLNGQGILCMIQTSNQEVLTVSVQKYTLRCQFINTRVELVGGLESQKWYFLSLQYDMMSGKLRGFLNDKPLPKNSTAILKADPNRQLSLISFGRDFQGKIGSIAVLAGSLENQNLFKQFSYGIESWETLKNARNKKIFEHCQLAYLPFLAYTHNQHNDSIFDIFRKNHGQLMQNTSIYNNKFQSESLAKFGGLKILLPLFYIIQFYEDQKIQLLEEALSITLLIFQHKFPEVEKEALDCNFFPTIAMHINKLPSTYITHNFTLLLKDLKASLHDSRLRRQFFVQFLWTLKISHVSHHQTLQSFYNLILNSYQVNLSFYEQAFPINNILYYIVRNFQSFSHNCCLQHFVNQTILYEKLTEGYIRQLKEYQFGQHLKNIQDIMSYIIQQLLKSDLRKAIEQIKTIFRLLLQKHSTCFYIALLKIIEKILENAQQAEIILKECSILTYLFRLCQSTQDPEIISASLDIILYLYRRMRKLIDDEKVVYFLESLFQKIPVVKGQKIKLNLVRDIRKKSCQERQQTMRFPKSLYRLASYDRKEKRVSKSLLIRDVQHILPIQPKTISNSLEIYNSIKKFYTLSSNDQDIIDNDDAFRILGLYYRVSLQSIKELSLVQLLSMIKFSEQNAIFLQNSLHFNIFLMRILSQDDKSISWEMALKIAVALFEAASANQKIFMNYYGMVKACGHVEVILMEIMKKIKNEDESFEMLMRLLEVVAFQLYTNNHFYQPLLIALVNHLFEHLASQYVYLSQDYFETSSIFGGILQSKYQSPLKQYLLKNINTTNEDDVVVVFDNLVNKSLNNGKIEIDDIFKKNTYIIEIYMEMLRYLIRNQYMAEMGNINSSLNEQNTEQLDHLLRIHMKLTVIFITILTNSPTKSDIKLDDGILGRKIIMESLNFMYSGLEAPGRQTYRKYLIRLFEFLFEYITFIDNILGGHDNFSALLRRLNDLTKTSYNPFVIELFQYFIRNEENKTFISLIDAVNMVKYKFAYLDESIRKPDYFYCFSRPSLKSVINLCRDKDSEQLVQKYGKVVISKLQQIDQLTLLKREYKITEEIIQLFDGENPIEEKCRVGFISRQEKNLRKTMKSWNKIWKKLRIYNNPYGTWMNQTDIGTANLKNFKSKVSKYTCSSSRYRPILSCSILQPWHIIRKKYQQRNEHLLNINMLPQRNMKKDMKYTARDIFSLRFFRKPISSDPTYRVIWLKDSIKIRGFLHLYLDYLLFQYDGVTQADSHLSFSQFNLEVYNELYKKWHYVDIDNIIRRRYLMNYSCIEILLSNNSSVLINFENCEQLGRFLDDISTIRKGKIAKYKELITANNVGFFTQNLLVDMPMGNIVMAQVTELWRKHKMSNFQYLMLLNSISSRSIHDYSQYPVFPWIVEMVQSKSPMLRELDKTMGGLGSKERIEFLKEKYNSQDPFNPVPKFFYGTHYSSPGVVFNYLIRLSPFTECCKKLQGGRFDLADRMFFSMLSSWKSVIKEMSDVRELIPQFYYLPEMYINIEKLNLGAMQCGDVVNDVELPMWAANPYHFVSQLRQILESQEVSQMIHQWIDLIFGYKQKGKEAQANLNVFYYLTYEGAIDLDSLTDEVHKTSCQAQIIHFGQTPSQIFDKPHLKRQATGRSHFQLDLKGIYKLPSKEISDEPLGLHLQDNQFQIILKNRLVVYSLKQQAAPKHKFEIHFQKSICKTEGYVAKSLYLLCLHNCLTKFFNQGKFLIITGYVDNSYRIYRTVNGELIGQGHTTSITASIHISKNQQILYLGGTDGCLDVIELKYDGQSGLLVKSIHREYFEHKIQHISENQNFLAVSYGEYVAIMRVSRTVFYLIEKQTQIKPFVRFFRSFKNRSRVNGAVIVQSPLFSLIVYDNLGLKSYGINGHPLATVSTLTAVNEVTVVKDSFLHDIVIYTEEDKLIAVSTPDLRKIALMDIPQPLVGIFGLAMLKSQCLYVYGHE